MNIQLAKGKTFREVLPLEKTGSNGNYNFKALACIMLNVGIRGYICLALFNSFYKSKYINMYSPSKRHYIYIYIYIDVYFHSPRVIYLKINMANNRHQINVYTLDFTTISGQVHRIILTIWSINNRRLDMHNIMYKMLIELVVTFLALLVF